MPAFTMIALGIAAAAGVAGQIASVNQQKKAAAAQQAAMRKQEAAAREAAAKQQIRPDTGAKVKLGSPDDPVADPLKKPAGADRTGSVRNVVGGLTASNRLGV